MKFDTETLERLNTGEMGTLELFGIEHGVFVLTVKVSCPKCGHSWGIKVDDYDSSLHIPKRKFVCAKCGDE